jgi:CheY-like chemotaxis protein
MADVLIIDDDEDFAEAVAAVLESEGYQVALEHDPANVMECLNRKQPDAILLDVMFPENPSEGFELARRIRKQYPEMPILMLTAVNQQFPLGFSSKDFDPTWLPVADFLEKPVDFSVLCEKVTRLLS